MVKTCSVILNNEAVTVINYDGIEVQIPSIRREAKTVKVLLKDNKYIVVDDDYKEEIEKPIKKAKNKKTTKEESVEMAEDYSVEETPDA